MILPIITVGIEMFVVLVELVYQRMYGFISTALIVILINVFIASAIICGISIGHNTRKIKSNDGHKGKWVTGLVFSIVGTAYAGIFLTAFFITYAALI